jgi:hypothetical protein
MLDSLAPTCCWHMAISCFPAGHVANLVLLLKLDRPSWANCAGVAMLCFIFQVRYVLLLFVL